MASPTGIASCARAGAATTVAIPPGLQGLVLRAQGVVISVRAQNATYATTAAHDVALR